MYWRAILLLACLAWTVAGVAEERQNIVLIVVDDMGFSDFGAFGGEIDTPNIDALARAGVRFANFHVAASCAPTRAMLLTGVDHHLAGIGNMWETMPFSHRGKPGYQGVLNDRVTTVASYLQVAGYRTSVAGKWHLGHAAENLPPARGFDYSVIQADNGADNFEMRPYLPLNPEARWYENGARMRGLPEEFYSSTFFVDRTLEFLESGGEDRKPFFAYIAFQANHTPIQAPAEFIERYRGRYSEGWNRVKMARMARLREYGIFDEDATFASGPSQDEWDALTAEQQYYEARRMQAYAGMATAMDHEVGRLIAYLQDKGLYANTVFVVLSDNGATVAEPYRYTVARLWLEKHYHHEVESLGERGSWVAMGQGWGRVANTPLSGAKFTAGEGGVRVPLIVSGLASIEPGSVNREFVYVTDLAPTLLQIAAVPLPGRSPERESMTGASLLPMLQRGGASARAADKAAVGYEFAGNAALYQGGYKLVRNRPPAGDNTWRLFHISTDPGETLNLSATMPARFQAMQAQYAAYVEEVGVLPVPDNYVLQKQAMVNALVFFYLPRYLPVAAAVLMAVILGFIYCRRRRSAGRV